MFFNTHTKGEERRF